MPMSHHVLTFYGSEGVRVRSSHNSFPAVTLSKNQALIESIADLRTLTMDRLKTLHAHLSDGKADTAKFVSLEDTWERLTKIAEPPATAPRMPTQFNVGIPPSSDAVVPPAASETAQPEGAEALEMPPAGQSYQTEAAPRPLRPAGGARSAGRRTANPHPDSRPSGDSAGGKGAKSRLIGELLLRKEGCTSVEVMAACNWPSVSMPAQAKACGLSLRKEKIDGVTRYFGTPSN